MEKNNIFKWLLRIIGVITLGAIGSGAWQIVGEPLTYFITGIIVDSINFLSGSYRDSIYLRASVGFHESASTSIYTLIFTVPLFISFVALGYFSGKNTSKKELEEFEKHLDGMDDKGREEIENTIKILRDKINIIEDRLKKLKAVLITLMLIIVVLSLISATQMSYINRVITYVESSLDRLSPYESEVVIINLRGKFREVTTAKEYNSLYNEIESLLKKNNLPSKGNVPI